MKRKVKLAFEELESQMAVIDQNLLKFITGGDGDCLADTLGYIFNGLVSSTATDYYRNQLVDAGIASAIYTSSGNVAYLDISDPSGFINYLDTAVSGYHVSGNLATGTNTFDSTHQTLAKIDLGGTGPSGESVSHAVIITGKNPDGSYNYKDVVNNSIGTIQASQIQASVTIVCD